MCSETDCVCVPSNFWSDITGCMLMVKWSSALGHSHCFIFVLDGYCMLKKMISQPCMYKYVLYQWRVGDLCAITIESILEETARSVVYNLVKKHGPASIWYTRCPYYLEYFFFLGEWNQLWFWTAVNLLCCVIRKRVPVNSFVSNAYNVAFNVKPHVLIVEYVIQGFLGSHLFRTYSFRMTN